jgi:hypothetical protein
MEKFQTLDEFWPFYISQHMKKATRRLHFAGTTAGLLWLLLAVAQGKPLFFLFALLNSYGFDWFAHFFIERNSPATFQYPLLSFRANFRAYAFIARGEMEGEIVRLKDRIAPFLAQAESRPR